MAGKQEGSGRLAYVPALDGLRAVALLGVLCFHGRLTGAGGGFLGVSTFFTLSGFLITSILLLEWERTGRIDLRRFWTRRARRLLPAALVALLGIGIYGIFVASGHAASRIGGDGLSALFYVANWRFVLADQSYAALFSAPSPVQHFWSLAIEEQFYLLFPLLMVGVLPFAKNRQRLGAVLIGLAGASAALAFVLWSPGHDPSRVYYGTDTRAVELLVGAYLATRLAGRRRVRVRRRRVTKAATGLLAFGALLVLWSTASQSDTFLYRGGLPLNAVLTGLVITGALVPGPLALMLSWRPLVRLGLVSYGAYLYHWPIFLWLDEQRVGVGGLALFSVRVGVTLALATLSFRYLEAPVRGGRRITGWRPRLVAPIGAGVAAALLLAAPGAAAGPGITFSPVRSVDLRATASARSSTLADPAPTLPLTGPDEHTAAPGSAVPTVRRIMIVGDSVALTLARGMERWGERSGVEIYNAARIGCPIARGGTLATEDRRNVDQCSDQPADWAGIMDRFHPDVVVALSTVWDAMPRRRDAWGPDEVGPGDPRFDRYVRSEWAAATEVLEAHGARVVWLDPPCAQDPAIDQALRYARNHFMAGPERAGATTIDLSDRLCPDGRFVNRLLGVDDIRPDGLHFSDPGADVVAGWLGPQLMQTGAAGPTEPTGQERIRRF